MLQVALQTLWGKCLGVRIRHKGVFIERSTHVGHNIAAHRRRFVLGLNGHLQTAIHAHF